MLYKVNRAIQVSFAIFVVLVLTLSTCILLLSGGPGAEFPLPIDEASAPPEGITGSRSDPKVLGNDDVKTIVITPTDKTLKVNSTLLFSAKGFNETGHEVPIEPKWNSTMGTFSEQDVNTTMFKARNLVGKGVVEAAVDNIKAYANVTLEMGDVTGIRIEPNSTQVVAGGYKRFTCYAFDQYGNSIVVTPYSWGSNVGQMVDDLLLAQTDTGKGEVTATYFPEGATQMKSAKAAVTIIPEALDSIEITPRPDKVVVGSTVMFNTTGYDRFGNVVSVSVEWNVTNELGLLMGIDGDSTNLTMTESPKKGTLEAAFSEDIRDSIEIELVPDELFFIEIYPNMTTVKAGETFTLYAGGFDRYGNPVDRDDFSWTAYGPQKNSSLGYSCTFNAPSKTGNYSISASIEDVRGSANITVVPGDIYRLVLEPPKKLEKINGVYQIVAGTNQTFAIKAYDAQNNLVGVSAVWSSDVGQFEGNRFTAQTTTEEGIIFAVAGPAFGSIKVNIISDELVDIEISPENVEVEAGETMYFTAEGRDRYGNPVDILPSWDTDVGLLMPTKGETTRFTAFADTALGHISASFEGHEVSTTVRVVDKTMEELRIMGTIPDQNVTEDSPFWYLFLRPYESKPGLWYLTGRNHSLFTVKGENSTNDILIFTPRPDAYGSNRVTLWVWNEYGEMDSQSIWIRITAVDDPPKFRNPPDLRVSYKEKYVFDYTPYIFDVDSPCSLLKLEAWYKDELLPCDGFKVTYSFGQKYLNSSVNIRLELSDCSSDMNESIEIFIAENLPPRINPRDPTFLPVNLEENGPPKDLTIGKHFEDPEKGRLTLSISDTHVNTSISDNDKVLIWAGSEWSGSEYVVFRAMDELGAFCEDWLEVTVIPKDDPPNIRTLPKLVVHYDEDYHFNLEPYITDVDTPLDLLKVTTNNQHVTVLDGTNLVLNVNFPEVYYQQQFEVLVNVSDGSNQGSTKLVVKVTDNSIPWLLEQIPDLTFREDERYLNAINLKEYFFDPDGDSLDFVSESTNIKVQISLYGDVSLVTSPNWNGEEQVIFRALDVQQAFVETTIKVTVEPVNDPPTMDALDPVVMVNETQTIDLTDFNLEDIDNDIYTLEISVASSNPDLLVFVSGQDIIMIVNQGVTNDFATEVTVTISDGENSITQTMPVEVDVKTIDKREDSYFGFILMFIVIGLIILAVMLGAYLYFYRGFYSIDEIYLVYKDGRLIFHKVRPGLQMKDEDIVTSMLTAIQEFVEETFSQGAQTDVAIKKMEFGGRTIVIEKGQNVYMAVILKGIPGMRLQRQMAWIIEQIEKEYAKELKRWNGVTSKVSGVYKYLNMLLKTKNNQSDRVNFVDLTR